MPYDCREINVLEQYLNSVGSTELKEHVIFQRPKSLDAAFSHTVGYEAVKGNQVAPSKPNIPHDEGYIQAVKQGQKEKTVPPNTYKELNDLIQTLNICMEKWNKTLAAKNTVNTEEVQPTETSFNLTSVDGTALDIKGKLDLQFGLGELMFQHEFLIADIDLPGILGLDFLEQYDITIKVSDPSLQIGDKSID